MIRSNSRTRDGHASDSIFLTVLISREHHVVTARQRARQIAELVGFDARDQTRIATAVSEVARNALTHGGGGRVEFLVEHAGGAQVLGVQVSDQGPGIADVALVLEGRMAEGYGAGIPGARRLMDRFEIESAPGKGTTVLLGKVVPPDAPLVDPSRLSWIAEELARQPTEGLAEEVVRQNQELLTTLQELRTRQAELVQLNRELEDTNRGVVALYAELDERAEHLRRADHLKSRFLSDMSHEFRTPLNSILALCRLLLDRMDGDLTPEQEKQVSYMNRAAESLRELVDDLLDLAKIEAGKTTIHPVEFRVEDLFSALRGMLRPLLINSRLELVFEESDGIPPLYSDEGKVSQVLRNLVSNALKYTVEGGVRVSARLLEDGTRVAFAVQDTGVGIAQDDQELIFQEFAQVESHLQRRIKGTGLGLPLSRQLCELLGGTLTVESEAGKGSTFTATIPVSFGEALQPEEASEAVQPAASGGRPVLVIEDSPEMVLLYRRYLANTDYRVVAAATLHGARRALGEAGPVAVILDILLVGEDAWGFLEELKQDAALGPLPVIVVSTVDERHRGIALGADEYRVKPVSRGWLLETLDRLCPAEEPGKVLIADDDEASRYLLKKAVAQTPYSVLEAPDGETALRLAREAQPRAIFLDLRMPGMDGFEVLARLKADPAARDIPVIVNTSKTLTDEDRRRLAPQTADILSKLVESPDRAVARVREALSRALGSV